MSTTTATTIISGVVSDLGAVLASVLPEILTVFAGLVALGMLIGYVRKWIGRK